MKVVVSYLTIELYEGGGSCKSKLTSAGSPVPSGGNEVETTMDSSVRDNLFPINAHFLIQILVKLLVDVLNNRHPARETTRPH